MEKDDSNLVHHCNNSIQVIEDVYNRRRLKYQNTVQTHQGDWSISSRSGFPYHAQEIQQHHVGSVDCQTTVAKRAILVTLA